MTSQNSRQMISGSVTRGIFDPGWTVSPRRQSITNFVAGAVVVAIAIGSLSVLGGQARTRDLSGAAASQARVFKNPLYVAPITAEMSDAGFAGAEQGEPVGYTYATPQPQVTGR